MTSVYAADTNNVQMIGRFTTRRLYAL